MASYAAKNNDAQRSLPEVPCPFRTDFQRDRDRIIHSKAFRRLAHKTQVFINSTADHYRTRLTHTMEVSQIARTLARTMSLNEDLTEAIALGHDLGHTPFGHCGERVLNRLHPTGFTHQQQSLRVVDHLAKNGQGLNLTDVVRDGIAKHSKGQGPIFACGQAAPITLEGQLVRVSDIIAYLAHDLDDAFRAGILTPEDLPQKLADLFGPRSSTRIGVMVNDILANSHPTQDQRTLHLAFSQNMESSMRELREFLYNRVYQHPKIVDSQDKINWIIEGLYKYFTHDRDRLKPYYPLAENESESLPRLVCDFISGMTDRYALNISQELFWPKGWP